MSQMIKKLVVVSLAAAAFTAVAATANAAPGVHGHFGGWHGEYDHDHDYGHYGYGHYGYGHWGYGNYWGYGSYYDGCYFVTKPWGVTRVCPDYN
jgi:hypothetical protein